MPTPHIEEMVSKVPRSFTITTHEEHPYSSEYVDIEDVRTALNQAHQAGIKEGERKILDTTIVGWNVDIHQLDGTTCKWRLIERFETDED